MDLYCILLFQLLFKLSHLLRHRVLSPSATLAFGLTQSAASSGLGGISNVFGQGTFGQSAASQNNMASNQHRSQTLLGHFRQCLRYQLVVLVLHHLFNMEFQASLLLKSLLLS